MTASHTLCTLNEWVGLRGCVASNPLAGVGSVRMLRLSEGESPYPPPLQTSSPKGGRRAGEKSNGSASSRLARTCEARTVIASVTWSKERRNLAKDLPVTRSQEGQRCTKGGLLMRQA